MYFEKETKKACDLKQIEMILVPSHFKKFGWALRFKKSDVKNPAQFFLEYLYDEEDHIYADNMGELARIWDDMVSASAVFATQLAVLREWMDSSSVFHMRGSLNFYERGVDALDSHLLEEMNMRCKQTYDKGYQERLDIAYDISKSYSLDLRKNSELLSINIIEEQAGMMKKLMEAGLPKNIAVPPKQARL